jgi:predicted membrane protein
MNGESNVMRVTPRLIVGFGILALGLLWTLDNLDVLESERITEWWPAVIILIGVVKLFDPHAGRLGGGVLILIGTILLLGTLDLVDWDFGDLIPLGIALVGAKLIWDALRRKTEAPAAGDANSEIHAFAMMGGIHRQSTSQSFRGGSANAIMGGVELDLRTAQVKNGERVVMDTFAMWGGIEITVPENWVIVGEVLPLMGGFDDKTRALKDAPGPVLVVRGVALMGAVIVKN